MNVTHPDLSAAPAEATPGASTATTPSTESSPATAELAPQDAAAQDTAAPAVAQAAPPELQQTHHGSTAAHVVCFAQPANDAAAAKPAAARALLTERLMAEIRSLTGRVAGLRAGELDAFDSPEERCVIESSRRLLYRKAAIAGACVFALLAGAASLARSPAARPANAPVAIATPRAAPPAEIAKVPEHVRPAHATAPAPDPVVLAPAQEGQSASVLTAKLSEPQKARARKRASRRR